jgi:hypothetical protein
MLSPSVVIRLVVLIRLVVVKRVLSVAVMAARLGFGLGALVSAGSDLAEVVSDRQTGWLPNQEPTQFGTRLPARS